MPAVVAVNRRPEDTDEEVELVSKLAAEGGAFAAGRQRRLRPGRQGRRRPRRGRGRGLRRAQRLRVPLRGRQLDQGQDRDGRRRASTAPTRSSTTSRPRRRSSSSPTRASPSCPVCMAKTPLSLSADPDAARRARGLPAAGPRRARLHRRRLAGAAVRRRSSRCPGSARRRPPSTSTSTPRGEPSGSSRGSSDVAGVADRQISEALAELASPDRAAGRGRRLGAELPRPRPRWSSCPPASPPKRLAPRTGAPGPRRRPANAVAGRARAASSESACWRSPDDDARAYAAGGRAPTTRRHAPRAGAAASRPAAGDRRVRGRGRRGGAEDGRASRDLGLRRRRRGRRRAGRRRRTGAARLVATNLGRRRTTRGWRAPARPPSARLRARQSEAPPELRSLRCSRSSLVDVTETALRERLAPGRARPGDRLPPEQELRRS